MNLRLSSINLTSCFEIFLIDEGSSWNHLMQTNTQIKPINPFMKNGARHPKDIAIGTTSKGAIAAPAVCPTNSKDMAREVSSLGNHLQTTAVPLGYAPASPIPKRKRVRIKE
jgi:hypothetical protein